MKAFSFISPLSGAINFRGISGTLLAIDRVHGNALRFALDDVSTLTDNRLLVQCKKGVIDALQDVSSVYNQAQFYITPQLDAGRRFVSADQITDKAGVKISEPDEKSLFSIGFELDIKLPSPGPHIWVAWMVSKAGKTKLTVMANGTELRSVDVTAANIDEKVFNDINFPGGIIFKSHIAPKLKAVTVGDIVTFPFNLDELEGIKEIRLIVQ